MKWLLLVTALLAPVVVQAQAAAPNSPTLAAILQKYDSGEFRAAADLLSRLKTELPAAYDSLPFALLRARALENAGDPGALDAYTEASRNKSLSRFALLPLARLAAAQGNAAMAVQSYQQYLANRNITDFSAISREALEYCFRIQKPDALRQTAEIVRQQYAFRRLADYYIGKSCILRNDAAQAAGFFHDLIRKEIKDDITSLALTELDALEGKDLGEAEKVSRGKLAYRVWNFELARKYLERYALLDMDTAYFYARALGFLGQPDAARKTFQVALGLWPQDKIFRLCMYQYANFCLRQGDNQRAADLFSQLRAGADGGDILENSTFNLVEALRAQSKLDEALRILNPYCVSRKRAQRERALFLRTRIYFQGRRYKEALIDINQLLEATSLNRREILFWKGMILERMDLSADADRLFDSLATGDDFFSLQVYDRLAASGRKAPPTASDPAPAGIQLCRVPGADQENAILERASSQDLLTPFLYLHLYEDAARLLPSVSTQSWRILGVDSTDRLQKLLSVAYIAGLGRNYPVATYYAEIFMKALPRGTSLLALSPDVLHVLFPLPYRDVIRKFAAERKIDPFLVISIMKQESKFKEYARSQAFARGLMQLIPSTAMQLASDLAIAGFSLDQLYKPEISINLGTRYVQDMVGKFGSRVEVIAASYNSGESNVRRWLALMGSDDVIEFYSNIDLPETKTYVNIVKTNYELYRRIYAETQR
ncbi:MAG TPA: lytic transglycosylase domain-containing protein [Acidobacteriota bacterium]|nr:lytic transglycosylase domain-containing protein [Acidobacteriota bacterium]